MKHLTITLYVGLLASLIASVCQAQIVEQSYSEWSYEATSQRYLCDYFYSLPGQTPKKHVVVYYPSRPDYLFYFDPNQRDYWGRCASVHHASYATSQMKWSYFQNNQWTALSTKCPKVPDLPNGPEIVPPKLPVLLYNANQPLDLAPAIADTRQVFEDYGLPFNWYQTLQRGNKPGVEAGEYPLFLTGVWEMLKPEVSRRFGRRYQMPERPTSEIYNGAISSNSAAFEEMLLLTLVGPEHRHTVRYMVQVPTFVDLPNLDDKFLHRDGSVNFTAIRDTFVDKFQKTLDTGVNKTASIAADDREYCQVISNWNAISGSPPRWAAEQLASRYVVRVEFVDGRRMIPGLFISGERRLVVESYIQIGYRKGVSDEFSPIFLAGPFHESNYQPVGQAQVALAAWEYRWRYGDCKKIYYYSDLLPKDQELTQEEQAAIEKAAADPTPAAERGSLVSVSGKRPDVTALHQQLHNLLAPGKEAVPKFPKPDPKPAPAPEVD